MGSSGRQTQTSRGESSRKTPKLREIEMVSVSLALKENQVIPLLPNISSVE